MQPAFSEKCWFSLSLCFKEMTSHTSHSSWLLCLKIQQLTPPSSGNNREKGTITESRKRERKLLLQLLLISTYLSHRESFQYPTTKQRVFPLNVGHSTWGRQRKEVSSVSVFRHRMCWGLWAEIPTFSVLHGERVTAAPALVHRPRVHTVDAHTDIEIWSKIRYFYFPLYL